VFITFFILHSAGKSINAMVLSGLALAFSRLIDDSVVVIENVYRHLEMGEEPAWRPSRDQRSRAGGFGHHAGRGGRFFPVTFLFGVSQYLFGALALGVVLALFASYFDAVTVVPLFCANYLKAIHEHEQGRRAEKSPGEQGSMPGSMRNSRSC
jgi:multidrug efflux pump subunit AcrB